MATVITEWIARLVDDISTPVTEMSVAADAAAESVDGIGDAAKNAGKEIEKLSAMDLRAISESITDLVNQYDSLIQPGMAFEVQMKEMQAITRLANKEMEHLGDSARETAIAFGNDAAKQLESYSGIVAQFGPAVASDNVALAQMGENIAILSKSMQGNAVGAMDALTTSMLQFGVDINNPTEAVREMTRMMNVMVAAGNEGASEVSDTAEALKNAGVVAKQAGLSFEETNAALQAIAQGGRKGAEAGVALRNILVRMEGLDIIPRKAREKIKQLGVDFDIVSDKTRPFTERLRELEKIQNDATLTAQIFGVENVAAAKILFERIDMVDDVTDAITGTNAAMESANIIMDSNVEKIARHNAWLNDLKISFYDITGSFAPFITGLGTVAATVANITIAAIGVSKLITLIKGLTIVTHLQTAAQWLWNTAIMANPIGALVVLIASLVAGIMYAWDNFEGFRKVVLGVWEVVKGFGNILKEFVIDRIKSMVTGIGNIADALSKLFEGDFSGAWDSAKQGASDIIGVADANKALHRVGNTSIADMYTTGAVKGIRLDQDSLTNTATSVSPMQMFQNGNLANTGNTPAITNAPSAGGASSSGNGVSLRGAGNSGGGGKSIVMNVYNSFSGLKTTREVAEDVAKEINNRLSDGLGVVG